ncbi:MFS transporter [Streptomyces hoynatensis]|uniref:DHA2 family efflux MFS transporter permease subunit n=1 Tax=Streptomyces hoynatensis TaxID=1141874 RepID=A0A3A9YMT2_9ACTN|nr:MFS transporter [Streptomyces hoynatensis]RKN37628.1 DHA2 family efflux MFS transporter permease subunit [Streptomyces hoynatensis]
MSDIESTPQAGVGGGRRWLALVFICLAQLMVVLDVTIVNIALPSAQADLDFSDGDRQWVVTAYTLAFGSLLLLGGRLADYTGRRRAFIIGTIGFAAASALGGAAGSFELLLAARALQGVFGALLAPAALSLLAVTFTETHERAKAFGIFGGIAAGGGAIGLLLGGWLTDAFDWRWCMYVNCVIAFLALCGTALLPNPRASHGVRLDLPGVLLVTTGLVAIVYGLSEAESEGWSSGMVLGPITLGVLLLAAFAVVEARTAEPLLRLRVVWDRTRGTAYLSAAIAMIGMLGTMFLLTFYIQIVKGYSPVKAGVSFLPMTLAVAVAAGGIASRLLPRVPPRALMTPGMLISACGLTWLTRLEPDSGYAEVPLVGMLLIGLGMGLVMAPAMNYATHGVGAEDAGVASGMVNTGQQIGGSIATALLNTLAANATTDYISDHMTRPGDQAVLQAGLVEGYTTAFAWAAGILAVGSLVIAALMNTPRPNPGAQAAGSGDPVPVHLG